MVSCSYIAVKPHTLKQVMWCMHPNFSLGQHSHQFQWLESCMLNLDSGVRQLICYIDVAQSNMQYPVWRGIALWYMTSLVMVQKPITKGIITSQVLLSVGTTRFCNCR